MIISSDHLNKLVRMIVIFATSKKEFRLAFEMNNKINLIIEAAQKRFGQFGLEKTSMREIAADLKLSKASLYYYFPDKKNLYKAVVKKEQEEFTLKISERILSIEEPEQLLREYAMARLSYFRTLLNLSRLRLEAYSDLNPVFRETISEFRKKEIEIVVKIFKKCIIAGIFIISDPDQTASLFLDLLKGLRVSVIKDKRTLFIDDEEYDSLLQKTIDFTDIFIKGLRIK